MIFCFQLLLIGTVPILSLTEALVLPGLSHYDNSIETLVEGRDDEDTVINSAAEMGSLNSSLIDSQYTFADGKFLSNSVLTSAFPVDLIVSYNDTKGTASQFLTRYASFSPILNVKLKSTFELLNSTACVPLHAHEFPDAKKKIIIVQRGDCSFIEKVTNLLESDLSPRAIVISNNEPHQGLVTMYSTNFNEDGLVTIPILFMTLEDYLDLKALKNSGIYLSIQTASLDGLVGVMILMAVSPTILLLVCYLVIKGLRYFRQKTLNARYRRIVLNLPIYIFNSNHLILAANFNSYLSKTHQVEDIPLLPSSSDDLSLPEPDLRIFSPPVINGTDITNMDLLFIDRDYFRTQKCSICLGHFVPLKSRVLVLKCRHLYHEECLSNWLINFRRSCPLCNENLNLLDQGLSSRTNNTYNTFAENPDRDMSYQPDQLQPNPHVYGEDNPQDQSSMPLLAPLEDDNLQNQSLQDKTSTFSSKRLGTSSHSDQIISISAPNNYEIEDSVRSCSSFVTTRSQLSDVMSSPFLTPHSTRYESAEEDAELFELSVSTIQLP